MYTKLALLSEKVQQIELSFIKKVPKMRFYKNELSFIIHRCTCIRFNTSIYMHV